MRVKALAFTLLLTGCTGETSENGNTPSSYIPTLPEPVAFHLPAGSATLYATPNDSYVNGGRVQVRPYTRPNKWIVYLASSNWSEGGTSRSQRNQSDMQHLRSLLEFVAKNNLSGQVSVEWLQYDEHPVYMKLVQDDGASGWRFLPRTLLYQSTLGAFDAYVVSPVSRQPGGTNLSYADWLRPFIHYANNSDGRISSEADIKLGINDPSSPFWDKWNRHILLVNPEGMVVDSWLSVGGQLIQVFPDKAMAAIVNHLGLDPDEVEYPDVNFHAYYDSEYKESLEQQTVDVFMDMTGKLNDR